MFNRTIIAGTLTADITVGTTQDGKEYGRFTIANNLGYGERQITNYLTVFVRDAMLKRVQSAKLHKGSTIIADGVLRIKSIVKEEPDGTKTYSHQPSLSMTDFDFYGFASGAKPGEGTANAAPASASATAATSTATDTPQGADSSFEEVELDNDLPF